MQVELSECQELLAGATKQLADVRFLLLGVHEVEAKMPRRQEGPNEKDLVGIEVLVVRFAHGEYIHDTVRVERPPPDDRVFPSREGVEMLHVVKLAREEILQVCYVTPMDGPLAANDAREFVRLKRLAKARDYLVWTLGKNKCIILPLQKRPMRIQ